jgi:carboxypeptidase Taq
MPQTADGVTDPDLETLRQRLIDIADLQSAAALLAWDQNTLMPAAATAARGRQLAVLRAVVQHRLGDRELATLLERLEPLERQLDPDSDEAVLLRVARSKLEFAQRVPAEYVARRERHAAASYRDWVQARAANDFAAVVPSLEATLELSREYAGFFEGQAHPADPLIQVQTPAMTVAEVRRLFGELRAELVPLLRAVLERPSPDVGVLHGAFPGTEQVAFAVELAERFGFDFERGRWDWTHHPFASAIAVGDVRLTTRARDDRLGDGLFATLHEAGHGIYGQGAHAAGPILDGGLGRPGGLSSAVHESQSRLWENLVGRGIDLWSYAYGALQDRFPALADVELERFYRAINRVAPTPIRVQADELTYNLHVMIRFDLELQLLEGELAIRDLPEAWNARYLSDLGITPPNDADGVLQDVHWFMGTIGGQFQGYALGNILSVQFYDAALAEHPDIPAHMRAGDLSTLHGWLQRRIYRHGVRYDADELVRRTTGGAIEVGPLVGYLKRKYGALYHLDLPEAIA